MRGSSEKGKTPSAPLRPPCRKRERRRPESRRPESRRKRRGLGNAREDEVVAPPRRFPARFVDPQNLYPAAVESLHPAGRGSRNCGKSGKRAYKGVGFYSVILLPIFYAKMRGTYMYVNQINLHLPLPTSISIARARNARRIEPATPRPPGRKFRIRQMESPFQKVPPQPQIPPALPGVRGMPPRSENRATYPSAPLRRE